MIDSEILSMGKVVITEQNNRLLLTQFDEKQPVLMETAPLLSQEGILGNIYLARVKDVVPGIKGAFLSVSGEKTVYLPLNECKEFLCANRELSKGDQIRQGDEIVVQIVGEALKTKQPTASVNINLTGQYCVCGFSGHRIRYSKKLSTAKIDFLGQSIKEVNIKGRKQYQFTIRTNAEALDDLTPLFNEMRMFINVFDTIMETYRYRTCHSCFYQPEPEIIQLVKNIPLDSYEEIVTDMDNVYMMLTEAFPDKSIRLYQDSQLSLSKLYSIDTHLKEALSRKVWLPCGGYLVIEPTEAMVVIDVNSGKAESKGKKNRDYCLKVNLEAAKEVARQLRLRNYSGMIMVDFINMENDADNQMLLECLDRLLQEDKVRTRLVDMTALGIVEITRKKVSKPLFEWFSEKL
ncbi:MAG: ribonuclease E/G [Suilimivivens sp.]